MKTRSFQQSLLQQILALDDSSFPSFTCSNASKNRHKSDICPSQLIYHDTKNIKSRLSNPRACSISDIEQDIVNAQRKQENKSTIKFKPNEKNQQKSRYMHKSNKIKTQISQQEESHPINYSTIYTRRSSIDESLYQKALKQQNCKKLWISRKQKQIQQNQLKSYAYKPSISQTSKEIMNKVDRQQLYQKMRKRREQSFRKIMEQSEKKQLKQCSFTPNIQKSQRNMLKSVKTQSFVITDDTKRKSSDKQRTTIFDQLYQDSKTRQLKSKQTKQKYLKQLSKKPIIDQISREITKNTNFQERRLRYQKIKLQKQIQQEEKQNIQRGSMHRPSINNTSHNRQKQLPIGDHLYLQSKQNKTVQYASSKPHSQEKVQVNKKSKEVYEERKVLVFYQIFKLLDGDEDGSISINSISLNALPHEIIKIIYPLIQELQLMDVQLQEHEFICSISNLFKTLSIHQKDILLGFVGNNKQQERQQYKLRINAKSKFISECNQRSQMSIYEYCSIKQAEKQKQLQTQRLQKSKRQLEKCTFQPKILTRIKY